VHHPDPQAEEETADDCRASQLGARDAEGGAAPGEPAASSGGIVSTAILIPKYVEPQST
jgi:hypothetical protein